MRAVVKGVGGGGGGVVVFQNNLLKKEWSDICRATYTPVAVTN